MLPHVIDQAKWKHYHTEQIEDKLITNDHKMTAMQVLLSAIHRHASLIKTTTYIDDLNGPTNTRHKRDIKSSHAENTQIHTGKHVHTHASTHIFVTST